VLLLLPSEDTSPADSMGIVLQQMVAAIACFMHTTQLNECLSNEAAT